MAARRERERRRPSSERRYRFAAPEQALEPEEAELEQDGQATDVESAPAQTRPPRSGSIAASTRGGVRAAAKPYSAYKDEYSYVFGDLRRVAAVIGGLLIALIVLYFLLPLLVH
jgi:hypothetical protein